MEYLVVGIQTTGYRPWDQIVQICARRYLGDELMEEFIRLVRPTVRLTKDFEQNTGIDLQLLSRSSGLFSVIPFFVEFAGELPWVVHNAGVCRRFLEKAYSMAGFDYECEIIDTAHLAKAYLQNRSSYRLEVLVNDFGFIDEYPGLGRGEKRVKQTAWLYQFLMYRNTYAVAPRAEQQILKFPTIEGQNHAACF